MRSDVPSGGATALRGANLLLRFLLELAMVVAFFVWGVAAVGAAWLGVALGLGAAALAVVAWGALIAPRARWRLSGPWRLVAEAGLFGLAGLALVAAGRPGWAIALVITAAVNIALLRALRLW